MSQEFLHEHKTFTNPQLKHLDIETSSVCNLSCNFCPRPKENGTMPIEDIKRLIKEFADMGGETIKPFWRGEPTLDERMPEILKWAKECGLKTMINSNATFYKKNVWEILENTDWISLSIDDEHNNIGNTELLCSIVCHRKFRNKNLYVEVQGSSYNSVVNYLCDLMGVHYHVDLPTKRSDKDLTSEIITGERKYCGQNDWRMVISYNGDCLPCCVMWDKSYILGNIYNNSLNEIFYGERANTLRKELKQGIFNNKECANCVSRSAYE